MVWPPWLQNVPEFVPGWGYLAQQYQSLIAVLIAVDPQYRSSNRGFVYQHVGCADDRKRIRAVLIADALRASAHPTHTFLFHTHTLF
jgi:RNase adaptor protein for sRNA GlmZ degradation